MMRRRNIGWLVLAAAAALGGCVGGSSKGSAAEAERLKAYVLDAVPSDIPNKLDINYENKIHLVGYKLEPKTDAKPGAEVKLTMYWRCDQKLDDGWNLFTHILDGHGERILNIDNVGPLRDFKDNHQALWPSAWEKGKVYVDEQSFKVPDDVKTPEIQITTGIWKGDARLKIVSGPGDKENRGVVARLKTGVIDKPAGPAHTEIPVLRVNRLAKDDKITIDGKLDEAAWKTAASTGPFVDVGTGNPNTSFPVNGSARVAWDDQNLYVAFQVSDPDIVGGFKPGEKDPHLWTKDTVEIMVDPDGDGDNLDYYEIQINPQNLVFDTQYDSYNSPKKEPDGPFGHEEWSAKLKSAVVVDGTVDKAGDKDKGYTVEAAIPWSSFGKAKKHPPQPGDTWRMNFYAMKNNGGVAWSPIRGRGNFHKASEFGRVMWMVPGASPAASASAAPAGSAHVLVPPIRMPVIPPGTVKAAQ
jgi:hypothetical protein